MKGSGLEISTSGGVGIVGIVPKLDFKTVKVYTAGTVNKSAGMITLIPFGRTCRGVNNRSIPSIVNLTWIGVIKLPKFDPLMMIMVFPDPAMTAGGRIDVMIGAAATLALAE
jgi:hypothetical protein